MAKTTIKLTLFLFAGLVIIQANAASKRFKDYGGRFIDNGNSTYTDTHSGLMWHGLNDEKFDWRAALKYCNELKVAGFDDWRLPSINELNSLDVYDNGDALKLPSFIPPHFTWSSTTYDAKRSLAYYFLVGNVRLGNKSKDLSILAVRGDNTSSSKVLVYKTGQSKSYKAGDDGDLQKGMPVPAQRFVDNKDGTATDLLTNLMWVSDASKSKELNYKETEEYCKKLAIGGYSDWTIPTNEQLNSLIDRGESEPALPKNHPFKGIREEIYWTCIRISFFTIKKMGHVFESGTVFFHSPGQKGRVLPVRKID